MVLVLPMYEQEQDGVLYNTAAVIDADGTYLGKYRKTPHPPGARASGRSSTSGPATCGYPVFDTAVGRVGVYICYDRHFPEGWRALGLNGAQIVFNPSATQPRAVGSTCGSSSSPPSAVANEYYIGAINRVGIEPISATTTSTARRYFVDPRGPVRRRVGDHRQARADRARPRHGPASPRCATTGRSTATAAPTPTTSSSPAERPLRQPCAVPPRGAHDPRRDIDGRPACNTSSRTARSISPTGAHRRRTCWSTARTIVGAVRARAPAASASRPTAVIDATGKYVIPGGIDVHTHMELPFGGTFASRHVRDRHPRRGVGRHHHHHRLRGADHGEQRARRPRRRGTARPTATAPSTTASTRSSAASTSESLKAMTYLVEHEGITSFKLFMAYPGVFYSDDGQILRAMQTAADNGAIDHDARRERHRHRRARRARPWPGARRDPKYHALTGPSELEGEATHRAIVLAKVAGNVPLYIVHMSAGEALDEVAARPSRGPNVFAETCPQYLYMTLEEHLAAARLRGRQVRVLAAASRSGSTTRATTTRPVEGPAHERAGGRVAPTTARSASRSRRSSASATSRRSPTASAASSTAWTSSTRAWSTASSRSSAGSRRAATTPARMFGLYPKKGVIAPGVRRRHRRSTTRTRTTRDRRRRQAPHEHGPLAPGRARSSTARSTPCCPAARWSSRTTSTSARKGHGQFVKRGLVASTWS